jgi:murein DD-endopeptidase MepM/ murein hydrolase activator NlpD
VPILVLLVVLFVPLVIVVRPVPPSPVVMRPVCSMPVVVRPVCSMPVVVRPVSAAAVVARAPARPPPFGWPVTPPHVVRRFDPPPQPWRAGHRGVDLSAGPSAPVRASGAGTVVYAGIIAGRGVVSVAHPGGFRTTYEPVASALHAGDAVGAGSVLGTLASGHPGCPTAACLHWGLRQSDRYLDPLALLGLGPVRLLPLLPHGPPVSVAER